MMNWWQVRNILLQLKLQSITVKFAAFITQNLQHQFVISPKYFIETLSLQTVNFYLSLTTVTKNDNTNTGSFYLTWTTITEKDVIAFSCT